MRREAYQNHFTVSMVEAAAAIAGRTEAETEDEAKPSQSSSSADSHRAHLRLITQLLIAHDAA